MGLGIYRNNILRGGTCATRYDVAESSHLADPRIFENNDLDPYNAPTALYVDEGSNPLTTIGAVNALSDATVGANLSVDASFVAYPNDLHILPTSMCVGAGTPAGAPTYDMDGQPRKTPTAIGADEP
jgi:hypothetical protein